MEKLRVVHTVDGWHAGGIAELVTYLAKFSRHSHNTWGYNSTHTPYMLEAGITNWEGGPPIDEPIDVVVGHSVGGWSHHNLSQWAHQRGAKIIEVVHSNAHSPTPPEDLDGWIGMSHIVRQMNPSMPKATTIYGLLDAGSFSGERGTSIGRLSRLVDEKRPQDVVELARYFEGERFLIAGDGALMGQLRSAAPSNVDLVGWVRNFPEFYSRLKLFVFPTRDECCAMSLAMAQAAGLPCIVQNLPSLHETTGGYAAFCSSQSEFVSQVGDFLSHPGHYDEMAAQGREWARGNFDYHVTAQAWDEYLSAL